jgi:uncharacterized membrane protein required for colicin V production
MFIDFFRQINWLDIFVIILLVRICYISIKNGLPVQLFWFLGSIAAVYLSLHYYSSFSAFLGKRFPAHWMPLEYWSLVAFIFLVLVGYFSFVLLQKIFSRYITLQATPQLNKYGGLFLGALRGILVVGLIIFLFSISSVAYLQNTVSHSYSGQHLFKIAPATYNWLWRNIMSKFMTSEHSNGAAQK